MVSRILQGLGMNLARASTQAAAVELLEPRPSRPDPRLVTTQVIRRAVPRKVADAIARDLDASPVFALQD
jgi:hypothetical protein